MIWGDMARWYSGIRAKLVAIFTLIKVVPLIVLAWFAWSEIMELGRTVESNSIATFRTTQEVVGEVGDLAKKNSIRALDLKSRENIERLTTDTARAVADFLQQRDHDILRASQLPPTEENYRNFLARLTAPVIEHAPWVLDKDGAAWVPEQPAPLASREDARVKALNKDNEKDFHSRPPEQVGRAVQKPLYLEMTYVTPDGREVIKITTTDLTSPGRKDVSRKQNTYCKAEKYFPRLKELAPGDIYVSEVIGAYRPSLIIGPYTKVRAKERGVPFAPEKAGYAGKENPVGRRFQGIIRWAAPVVQDGEVTGYVTLALDHTHVMEFTDHIIPTEERYSAISDAGSGNYAFMWDNKGRSISHPRDYFIVGYDPETGEPAVPWLSSEIYAQWQESKLPYAEFEPTAPWYREQSLKKKPAASLTKEGLIALDCRFLNFAPQCTGWANLTQFGGSGSFVIFWSGLWKLTTAAAIPYYTGDYKNSPRGFGFVTIGANVHEFHRSATKTAEKIDGMVTDFEKQLDAQTRKTTTKLQTSLSKTSRDLTTSTLVMIVIVILIAFWMAASLTKTITQLIHGIRTFMGGDLDYRIPVLRKDEIGELTQVFNEMADSILQAINDLRTAEKKYRAIYENAVEGMYQSHPDGRFLSVNTSMARIFGYDSPDDMLSAITDISSQLYPSPGIRTLFLDRLIRDNKILDFEVELLRKDGSKVWCAITARTVLNPAGELLYFEGMMMDISKRKAAEAELLLHKENLEQLVEQRTLDLTRANERLKEIDIIKTGFLSTVAHEIRTPMTSILGFAELIQVKLANIIFPKFRPETSKERNAVNKIKRNIKIIATESERLTTLVNDVLDIAKMEAGKLDWRMGELNVGEALRKAVQNTSLLAAEKHLALRSEIEPALPTVTADEDRIYQVLLNLISNAVKFTETGEVVCRASLGRDEILISVSDTGVGIPADATNKVFEIYRQIGDEQKGRPKGTGLGLAICKEIINHHGGRIWLESDFGRGCRVSFTLPLEAPDSPSKPAPLSSSS